MKPKQMAAIIAGSLVGVWFPWVPLTLLCFLGVVGHARTEPMPPHGGWVEPTETEK